MSDRRPDVTLLGYVGSQGGDTIQMFELAAGLALRGLWVRAVVPDLETMRPFAEKYREFGMTVECSPRIRFGRFQNPANVLRLLREARAPVVHIHTGDIAVPRVTLGAMDLLRYPHAFATIQSAYAEAMPVGSPRARYWAEAAARRFHKVVCPSEHSARAQVAYGVPRERVQVIHNSVDTEWFGGGDPALARRALGLPPGAPLVVFSARLHPQKRPLDAVAAFARVAEAFPDAHLALVGDGPLRITVHQAVEAAGLKDRVHFLGHRADVRDWLAGATVWFLPTEAENFSLAVLEALAAGRPVLSTHCRGNDEVLRDGENALTTGVGDVEAMAQGLRRLLADPALRRRLGESGRQTARQFTRACMVEKHITCYNEAINTR